MVASLNRQHAVFYKTKKKGKNRIKVANKCPQMGGGGGGGKREGEGRGIMRSFATDTKLSISQQDAAKNEELIIAAK